MRLDLLTICCARRPVSAWLRPSQQSLLPRTEVGSPWNCAVPSGRRAQRACSASCPSPLRWRRPPRVPCRPPPGRGTQQRAAAYDRYDQSSRAGRQTCRWRGEAQPSQCGPPSRLRARASSRPSGSPAANQRPRRQGRELHRRGRARPRCRLRGCRLCPYGRPPHCSSAGAGRAPRIPTPPLCAARTRHARPLHSRPDRSR
mmetsp:Transcript_7824/g.20592  ORF Transcript_7824/g.20592 Transcript_7824/m.20592 type:complete len:201 (-) Transcript_7824:65-667(-)